MTRSAGRCPVCELALRLVGGYQRAPEGAIVGEPVVTVRVSVTRCESGHEFESVCTESAHHARLETLVPVKRNEGVAREHYL